MITMAAWTRVEDDHPRWEIYNPNGDGHNYLLTDEAIRTFGRAHLEELMADLPPLPEQAWTPGPRTGPRWPGDTRWGES